MEEKISLTVTYEELKFLDTVLQNMMKHADDAGRIYATYREDTTLVSGLTANVKKHVLALKSGTRPPNR